MPDTSPTTMPSHASAAKGMFGKDIAGFPVWVWLVIIGAGIGAVMLVKSGKFSGLLGGSSANTTGSGLGLAIDPSTGLPYAVEGLQPSGAFAGGGGNTPGGGGLPPIVPPPTQPPTPPSVWTNVKCVTISTGGPGTAGEQDCATMPLQYWQNINGSYVNFVQSPPGVVPSDYWTSQGLGTQYQQFLSANPGFNPTATNAASVNPSTPQLIASPNGWPGQNGNAQVRIGHR